MAQKSQTAWPFQLALLVLFAAILAGVGLLLLRQASLDWPRWATSS